MTKNQLDLLQHGGASKYLKTHKNAQKFQK